MKSLSAEIRASAELIEIISAPVSASECRSWAAEAEKQGARIEELERQLERIIQHHAAMEAAREATDPKGARIGVLEVERDTLEQALRGLLTGLDTASNQADAWTAAQAAIDSL